MRTEIKEKINHNYGDYQHVGSPKFGAPNSIGFVQRLRASSPQLEKTENSTKNFEPTKTMLFSFYNQDNKKWIERIRENNKKELEKVKKSGILPGPQTQTVFAISDVESKGNTGAIEHLITPKSDKSLISFAFKLRNYKSDIRIIKNIQPLRNILKMPKENSPKTSKHKIQPKIFELNDTSFCRKNAQKNKRHNSVEPMHKNPWYNGMQLPKVKNEATIRIFEKYFDKFSDRNIAHFKMHFSPRNGKEQVEFMCKLRGIDPPQPIIRRKNSNAKCLILDDEYDINDEKIKLK